MAASELVRHFRFKRMGEHIRKRIRAPHQIHQARNIVRDIPRIGPCIPLDKTIPLYRIEFLIPRTVASLRTHETTGCIPLISVVLRTINEGGVILLIADFLSELRRAPIIERPLKRQPPGHIKLVLSVPHWAPAIINIKLKIPPFAIHAAAGHMITANHFHDFFGRPIIQQAQIMSRDNQWRGRITRHNKGIASAIRTTRQHPAPLINF